jgi:hypothetical protein
VYLYDGVWMDQEKEKSKTSENNFNDKNKEIYQEIENISIRNKSLENKRKDSQKPLYLYRYE